MRLVLMVLFIGLSISYGYSQQTSTDVKEMSEHAADIALPVIKPLEQTLQKKQMQEALKTYICQRCGSENQIDWSQPFSSSAFLPHCGACGKKYWPKFKPSSAIQRMYCSVQLQPHFQTN